MLNVDKIYVTHWDRLEDRRKLVENQFQKNGISDVQWVTSFDKESWDRSELEKEFPNIFLLHPSGRYLTDSEISLALKHCWILEDGYNKNYDSILVFEDDIILSDDFINKFNEYKKELPEDWDLCFIGSCCGIHAKNNGVDHVYMSDGSRCTHAYIVSKCGLIKIWPNLKKIHNAMDWFYNDMIKTTPLNNYWFEPSLVEQNNNLESSIQL